MMSTGQYLPLESRSGTRSWYIPAFFHHYKEALFHRDHINCPWNWQRVDLGQAHAVGLRQQPIHYFFGGHGQRIFAGTSARSQRHIIHHIHDIHARWRFRCHNVHRRRRTSCGSGLRSRRRRDQTQPSRGSAIHSRMVDSLSRMQGRLRVDSSCHGQCLANISSARTAIRMSKSPSSVIHSLYSG